MRCAAAALDLTDPACATDLSAAQRAQRSSFSFIVISPSPSPLPARSLASSVSDPLLVRFGDGASV